jgi:2'-5' RNA ligase
MAQRMFIALDIPAPMCERLGRACRDLPWLDARVSFVRPENIHVTLHFLGDVADADQPAVFEALAEATDDLPAFDFEVGPLACVPPGGRGIRMIWAHVTDPSGGLQRLYDALASALVQRGFGIESRPYRPHLTLARVKRVTDADSIRQAIPAEMFGCVCASRVVVYASELTKTGPIYSILGHAGLVE